MLYGLSKELRKLGIDCIEMTKLDISDYIDLAKNECRYILSRDSRYVQFCQELPKSQCLQIPIDSSVEQVINVINLLNINLEERNLFTRCMHCNSNEFILLTNQEMQLLRLGQVKEDYIEPLCEKKINPYTKTFKLRTFLLLSQ